MKVALSVRARNGCIYRYIKENGLTRQEFADLIGMNVHTVTMILNFNWKPNYRNAKSKKLINKLEHFFHLPINEIYPPESEARELRGEKVVYGDVEFVPIEYVPPDQLEWKQDPYEESKIDNLATVLKDLQPREEAVLRLKYGIGGGPHDTETRSYRRIKVGRHLQWRANPKTSREIEAETLQNLRRKVAT